METREKETSVEEERPLLRGSDDGAAAAAAAVVVLIAAAATRSVDRGLDAIFSAAAAPKIMDSQTFLLANVKAINERGWIAVE